MYMLVGVWHVNLPGRTPRGSPLWSKIAIKLEQVHPAAWMNAKKHTHEMKCPGSVRDERIKSSICVTVGV